MSDTAATDPRKMAESFFEYPVPLTAEEVAVIAHALIAALDRVAALEQERDLAAKAARDQAAGVGYQAAHTFAAESRLAAYREAADRLAEAHSTIKSRAVTRRIAVHVDGTAEWANPFIREVHDIAREALSVYATLGEKEAES